jgi:hypothetical protein
VKIKWHEKGYSSEDMCCPEMKELHEGGCPYYKIEFPPMKHQRKDGGIPWEKCS